MSVLLKLLKCPSTVLKTGLNSAPHRAISTTPTLLWFNKKFLRPDASASGKELKYMKEDNVPPSSQLIYRAPMDWYLSLSMHASTVTALLISVAALYQYTGNEPMLNFMESSSLVIHCEDLYYFASGFVVINLIMRFVVSLVPQRIYKDNGKYLAVFHSQLPGLVSQYRFNQGEVKDVYYRFNPWNNATYKLGTKTAFLFDDHFKTHAEFTEMSRKSEKLDVKD